jgi:hypothetical protein
MELISGVLGHGLCEDRPVIDGHKTVPSGGSVNPAMVGPMGRTVRIYYQSEAAYLLEG